AAVDAALEDRAVIPREVLRLDQDRIAQVILVDREVGQLAAYPTDLHGAFDRAGRDALARRARGASFEAHAHLAAAEEAAFPDEVATRAGAERADAARGRPA